MHRLLKRQLKKSGIDLDVPVSTGQLKNLIVRVEQAYIDADDDRNFMEHTLDVSSKEMRKLYEELLHKTEELEALNHDLDNRIKDAVTRNSEQEQMLLQQSRSAAMGEMIGNIAHQWRQPLNALSLLMQNIYYSFEAGELDKEGLERSTEKGQRLMQNMSKTIDDFRNFFKPNKEVEHFNLSKAIHSAVELVSASYKNNSINLELTLDDALFLDGYPNEFAQVLLNILSNAKDALPSKNIRDAHVHIKSYNMDNSILIEIDDNAGGIDDKIMKKIFEPYFTTKHQDAGTGIGLYMSKMIIENNMHGSLSAVNTEDGTKFVISMPFEGEK